MAVKSKKPAAPKKPRAKRGPKPPVAEREILRQEFIPGCEPQEPIPELDGAARIYFDAMQDRKAAGEEEDTAKTSLIMKMKENGVSRYETGDGYVISITDKANVSVKKKKGSDEFGGGDA